MKQGRKHRGFTLVELVVAAGALALLAVMVMTFTGFGNQVLKSGADSYDIQSGIRVAGETAVQQIRYASAIFTIPESTFKKGESGLTADWNYFGVEQTTDDKGQAISQIVNYIAKGTGHEKKIVAQSPPGTTFDIRFSQKDPEEMDKLIKVEIASYLEGQSTPYSTVETEVDALNALQVVDKYPGANCTAIAYRTDARPGGTPEKVAVNVVMVLDTSGSMVWNLAGTNKTPAYSASRTHSLREAGRKMVGMLSENPNIWLAYVTYSDYAGCSTNGITEFLNVYDDKEGINKLGSFFWTYNGANTSDPLNPVGGTNTGDGMRFAYYKLKKQTDAQRAAGFTKIRNYVVVMTDGAATAATYDKGVFYKGEKKVDALLSGYTPKYDLPSQWASRDQSKLYAYYDWSNESAVTTPAEAVDIGIDYASEWGITCKTLDGFVPYIVGLGLDSAGLRGLNEIKISMDCPDEHYHRTDSAEELYNAFETIAETIVTDTWHLTGPDI